MFTEGALNYLIIPVVADGMYAMNHNGQYVHDGAVTWMITQDNARLLAESLLANLDTFPPTLAYYMNEIDKELGGTDDE